MISEKDHKQLIADLKGRQYDLTKSILTGDLSAHKRRLICAKREELNEWLDRLEDGVLYGYTDEMERYQPATNETST